MEGLGILILLIPLYFLPSIIASRRKHQSSGGIFVLNLLLGWTFLGWVIALVWSCSAVSKPDRTEAFFERNSSSKALCPYCRAGVDPQARKCPHCAEWIEGKLVRPDADGEEERRAKKSPNRDANQPSLKDMQSLNWRK